MNWNNKIDLQKYYTWSLGFKKKLKKKNLHWWRHLEMTRPPQDQKMSLLADKEIHIILVLLKNSNLSESMDVR